MLIVTASEMAQLDRRTIEEIGIPGIVLMENAGRGAAAFYRQVILDLVKRRIAVVAGSGNNGGDGFVLARLFHEQGATVRVVCLRPPEKLQGDALTNFRILSRLAVEVFVWDENNDFSNQLKWIEEAEVIIDAILGTGLSSDVRGLYRDIIEAINQLQKTVLAVDLPSGLDASTGKILFSDILADATATFGLPKVGQYIE
ncbi:MAG: NAD(P)H-hydrate epimerase, partial [Desulforhabdus sp.]|nr:NAD(P)H-hydrate epimerase [Desulforhabdus sp.]